MPKWFQFCSVMLMTAKNWFIGCSGFHYKEWKGMFYPANLPQREWFAHYASQFNTLELNVTFYRFPQPGFLKNWFNQSPAAFLFSVKVPRLITHYKQFNDVGKLLDDFYTSVREGLGHKLGPVLFQLPPRAAFSEERLDKIMRAVNNEFINVAEFRHASWWNKKVYDALEENNVIFCGSSYPGLPQEPVVNGRIVYYRFHGVPVLFKSEYPSKQLMETGLVIRENEKPETVFIYFNNTASQAALNNARFLKNWTGAEL